MEKEMIVVMQMTRYVKVSAENFEQASMKAQKLHDGFKVLVVYEKKHGIPAFNLP
jgi:hypothetical protein